MYNFPKQGYNGCKRLVLKEFNLKSLPTVSVNTLLCVSNLVRIKVNNVYFLSTNFC